MDKLLNAFTTLYKATEQEIYTISKDIPPEQLNAIMNKLTVLRKRLQKTVDTWSIRPPESVVNEVYKTPQELKEIIGSSVVTIYKKLNSGEIKSIRIGNKHKIPMSQFKLKV